MRSLRHVAVLAALVIAASQAGCATIGRERCAGDAPGEATTERDQVLVKRLLRTLFTDDFAAFQRLQPTESQYVTLAWRFGTGEADEMMSVIREPAPAATAFQAVRTRMAEAKVDVRTATRCTRRIDERDDEPRFYTLDISFGEGASAQHVRADAFDSGGRVSIVGPLGGPGVAASMSRMIGLMEGLAAILERPGTHDQRVALARAYVEAHKGELRDAQREVQDQMQGDPEAISRNAQRFAQRTVKVAERVGKQLDALPDGDPLKVVITDFFGTAPSEPMPEPTPEPTPTVRPDDPPLPE